MNDSKSYFAINCFQMLIMAGPKITMNKTGKMKSTRGKTILTGAFMAFSCAR
jgi:hypothetical protein